ncbi:class I SAM-dependent methyltransferase [Desulforhopalus singaporensis]|uniref:Methyltransferase domain-containing protein n=1 Tax=Desulforhopalus singaporensis TaxID=91360 RepID=A0A1H0U3I5_9BACT|nr:class I SAM-dependent methyltransferase [Desulforhopalus singaporensis]SDP60734.1 Methyltransferase domain-containing protein [Desulforhopalus singaporensis]
MTTTPFDSWTDKYDRWFTTPTGLLVKKYETELLLELLSPGSNEKIVDVGCGTGIFTRDILALGAAVIGLDLSWPMLEQAVILRQTGNFSAILGDMTRLPFDDSSFDKAVSMTAIEFTDNAHQAISELSRVTRRGGRIVVTTLNSLSPWAQKRRQKAREGHPLFTNIHFRSPGRAAHARPGKRHNQDGRSLSAGRPGCTHSRNRGKRNEKHPDDRSLFSGPMDQPLTGTTDSHRKTQWI